MPLVQGKLAYDEKRMNQDTRGIAGVPILLQSIPYGSAEQGLSIAAITNNNGDYTFRDVPPGNYQVVEYDGYTPAPTSSDVNFSAATMQPIVRTGGRTPAKEKVGSVPEGTTGIDAVNESTQKITVGSGDMRVPTIRNGPVKYTGFEDQLAAHGIVVPDIKTTNMISGGGPDSFKGSTGTFGTYPQGTKINTREQPEPFGDLGTKFTFTNGSPKDGQYGIGNSKLQMQGAPPTWWNLAGKTSGNEMDKFAIVNGDNPGQVVLSQTVNVKPNSSYLMSVWIANMMKIIGWTGRPSAGQTVFNRFAEPQVSLRIKDQNGSVLYDQMLGQSLPANERTPEWKQFGDLVKTGADTTSLTMELVSEGAKADGNDYAIDDFSVREVKVPSGLQTVKKPGTDVVAIGDQVTYTVTMKNTYQNDILHARFTDIPPKGLSFVPGSVKVNGVSQPSYDPNAGFPLPDPIKPGETVTVTYISKVDELPNPNPAVNTAKATYDYNFIKDNTPTPQAETTPGSPLTVGNGADITTLKTSNKTSYMPGETVLYTITVTNNGPQLAKTPTVTDTVPTQIEDPTYSVDGGAAQRWTGSITLPDMPKDKKIEIRIQGKIKSGMTGSVSNTVTVTSPTPNKTGGPNTSTATTPGNPSISETADVKTTKAADKKDYVPGENITYTITVVNNGPAVAKVPKVTDNVPSQISNPQFSVDGGPFAAWNGETTLPDMPKDKTTIIKITGRIKDGATGNLANTATVTTPTPNKDGGTNTTTGKTADDPKNGDPLIGDRANVTTKKSADKKTYAPGEAVTYTITVTNNGPSTAKAPKVSDSVPSQISNPQFSVDGSPPAAWSGETTLPDMPNGKSVVIKITGTVKNGATGPLANTATTTTSTPNKDGGPNTSTGKTSDDPINGDPVIGDTADVSTTKTTDKTNYLPGDGITYTVTVTNNGPGVARSPRVSDTIPTLVENPQFSVDGGSASSWTGETTLPDMQNGKVTIIKITGTIKAGASGSLANTATTTTPTPNKNGGPNISTGKTPGDPSVGDTADVTTKKTADKKNYLPGSDITYTITVTNNGPGTAKTPKVTDAISQQIENPRFSVDSGTPAAWSGETTLPDMPNGKVSIITITGKVKADATGTLANSATVTSPTPNKTGGPNTSTGKTSDDPKVGDPSVIDTADVVTKKAADKKNYKPGETVAYTITVTNNGPAVAKTPKVTDNVPSQIANPQFSVDGGTPSPWTGETTLPDMPKGKSTVVKITGTVKSGASGSLANTATVTTTTPDKTGGPNTTTGKTSDDPNNGDPSVGNTADVTTKKTADKPSYLPGETVTYTITVTNNGPAPAIAPKVSDAVPAQIENPKYSVDGGTPAPWPGEITLPDMPSGKITLIMITGKVKSGVTGSLANSATTTTATPNKDGGTNTSTGKTSDAPGPGDPTVGDTADIVTKKTADKKSYNPGDTVTYTVTVTNNGPATAKAPKLNDNVPSQLQNAQYSVDGGVFAAWPGEITLPDMPKLKTTIVRITGTIKAGATGNIGNTATTTTTTPNKDGGPNITTGKTTDDPINGDPVIGDTADVKTIKVAEKKNYNPGESITYTITVTNNGPAAARTPKIRDAVPPQIENPQFNVDGGSLSPWTGETTLPDMPNGKITVIKITGKIKSGASGSLANSATTTTTTPNKTGGDNTTTGKTGDDPNIGDPMIGDTADVKTTKYANKKLYNPGDAITYTIVVTNNGPATAKSPRVSDNIPSQVESPQFSVDGGSPQPWAGETTLPDMPKGKITQITITGKVKVGSSGNLSNSATTMTPTPNKDGGPNTTTGKTGDDPINGDPSINDTANVKTVKAADKKKYVPGEPITYTITVANGGPGVAKSPKISDNVPSQIQNVQFTVDGGPPAPWTGETTLPDMPNGKVTAIKITGTVKNGATGSLTNSATTATPTPNKDGGPNTTTGKTTDDPINGDPVIGDTADIVTKKTADKKSYNAGNPITYTITVTNNGPSTAKTPVVRDNVPSQIQNVQFSVDGGPTAQWTGETTLTDMPAGKVTTIKITGTIKAGASGNLANSATVTTPTPNKNGGDNTTTGKTGDDPINGDPLIGETADVKVTKVADKKNYIPGDTIIYTITVTNSGPSTAKAPRVTDTVPSQLENPQFTVDGGATNPWSGTATLPDMPSGMVSIIKIIGKIKTGASGSLANSATVTTATPNKDGGPNTVTGKTGDDPHNGDPVIGDTADVKTTKVADKKNYNPGDIITYTVTVINSGPATARTPRVTDNIPEQIENPQFTVDGGVSAPWPGAIALPDMPSGKVTVVKITGRVRAGASGSLANSATTTTPTPNKDGGNNTTTGRTTDDPLNGDPVVGDTANVVTAKTADKKFYNPGETITYTITVTNSGPATAKAPRVTDKVPEQLETPLFTVDESAPQPWTGATTLPDMPKGKVTVIKITGRVKVGASGSLTNSATTATPTPNKNGGDNTTTGRTTDDPINGDPVIGDTANVRITKVADKKNYTPGDTITYTVTVINSGPATARTPKVTDAVPQQVDSPQFTVDGGMSTPWTGETTLPDMPNGKVTTIRISGRVKPGASGSLANSATVTTPTPNRDGGNNTSTGRTGDDPINGDPLIGDTANITTKKAADKKNYNPGETITYTITVSNSGPATAKAPKVIDAVPLQVENPHFTVDGGATQTWTGETTLPDMPNGKTTVIKITGTVKAGATGSLANSSTVTSPTPNNNGGNNTTTGRTVDDPTNGDPSVTETANVKTSKAADKKSYNPGETIIYTITVINSGPGIAKAPKITDAVPLQVENPQFSVDGGLLSPWNGETTLPDMPSGKVTIIRITGKIKAGASGNLFNSATTTTTTPNKDGGSNITTGKTTDDPINGDPIIGDTANVRTTKVADKKSYIPGETIVYTITVINSGPATAKAPKVTDSVPPAVENPQFTVDGGPLSRWTGETTLPDMPSGKITIIKIAGTVKAGVGGNLSNSATTATPTPNKDGGNNTTTGKTSEDPINGDPIVVETADISIMKAADKANVKPGEVLTYTVTVTNNGPAAAKALNIDDSIGNPVESVQFSLDRGLTWAAWPGSVTLPDLAAGASTAVMIRGTINRNTAPGTLSNTATARTTTPGKDGGTTPKVSTTVNTNVTPVANLVITVTVDKDRPIPGDTLTYNINVKNNGPAGAKTPLISFQPPRGLTNMEFSNDGGKTWTPWTGSTRIPDLPNGSSNTILVRGKIDGNTPNISSNITTTSETDDPESGTNTVRRDTAVTGTADVSATKTADKTAAKPGETLTYTITVANAGPSPARTPTVTDTVPAALENPQFSTNGGATWAPWTGSTMLPDVAASARASVQIRGTVGANATGSIANTATVTTPTPWLDGSNPPIRATTPPVSVSTPPSADVGITVNMDNPNPKTGDILTHTVTVQNKGPSPATNTEIGFVPPGNYVSVEYTTDGGKTWTPWTGTTTIPELPNGGAKQIQIRGRIDGDQPNITTTVTAKTKENDPNPGDNTVTTTTPVSSKPNLVTTIRVDRDTPAPGDTVTWTVTTQNNGPGPAKTPTMTYQPPGGVSNVEYSKDNGKTWTPWPGNTTLPDIPNGGSQEVLIRGRTDGSVTGTITTTVTVTTANDDPAAPGRTASSQINVNNQRFCMVTYYCNNAVREHQKVVCGTPAPRPSDPMRRNSSFAGWYTARRGMNYMWDFSAPVNGNLALYARWIMR